jgi:hypothetical protein
LPEGVFDLRGIHHLLRVALQSTGGKAVQDVRLVGSDPIPPDPGDRRLQRNLGRRRGNYLTGLLLFAEGLVFCPFNNAAIFSCP